MDNQNISAKTANTCKMYLNLLPLDDSATSKWFPWLTNGLWILTRNWVIFLQDMRISHSLLHVQWSYWQFSLPIRYVRRLAMWHVWFTIKNTHLNLALATVNKMAVRFFSSDGWWGELSQVLWWCAILCSFRVALMLKAIKCSINTYDRCKYRFFRVVYGISCVTAPTHVRVRAAHDANHRRVV